MSTNLSANNLKLNFLNFLFMLVPASFIAGNLVLNLNILCILIISIISYYKEIYKINFSFLNKLILLFFTFVIFSAIWNTVEINKTTNQNDYTILIKSLLFLRFLILIFVINFLVINKLFNFKWFLLSCLICSSFVGLDIIYQYFFHKDIFGIEPISLRKFSGPFGDELVAGGYIQRFSILGLFFLGLLKNKNKYMLFVVFFLFLIFLISIVFSGNRMPLILFTFSLFLICLLESKIRKVMPFLLVIISITISIFYFSNLEIRNNLKNIKKDVSKIIDIFLVDINLKKKQITYSSVPSYYHEFRTFYNTWEINKYIGGGIKSFRINCPKRQHDYNKLIPESFSGNVTTFRTTCNTHPHNYYLEILSDLGLSGFLILSSIFISLIFIIILNRIIGNDNKDLRLIMIAFTIAFIVEIIPLRTSGSFFTTNNATYIFLLLSFLISFVNTKKLD